MGTCDGVRVVSSAGARRVCDDRLLLRANEGMNGFQGAALTLQVQRRLTAAGMAADAETHFRRGAFKEACTLWTEASALDPTSSRYGTPISASAPSHPPVSFDRRCFRGGGVTIDCDSGAPRWLPHRAGEPGSGLGRRCQGSGAVARLGCCAAAPAGSVLPSV
jgi:hypothetical protein